MTYFYKPCLKCQSRGKIAAISKWVQNRYRKRLKLFEEGYIGVIKPKIPTPHINNCKYCTGSGLVSSENFPETENSMYPHIAIIGGGIGGMALAVACLHRGIPYTLYERDESFDARSQGYGLTLQQASKAIA
jgi:salicylate hydroxylase